MNSVLTGTFDINLGVTPNGNIRIWDSLAAIILTSNEALDMIDLVNGLEEQGEVHWGKGMKATLSGLTGLYRVYDNTGHYIVLDGYELPALFRNIRNVIAIAF